jgi:hypothetical protein
MPKRTFHAREKETVRNCDFVAGVFCKFNIGVSV